MKGHSELIAQRMAGRAPEWVFINDYPCQTDWQKWGDIPTVCVHGDSLHKLDLRFLVGLKVNISSTSEARTRELFQRSQDAGARLVVSGHIQESKHATKQDGDVHIFRKET